MKTRSFVAAALATILLLSVLSIMATPKVRAIDLTLTITTQTDEGIPLVGLTINWNGTEQLTNSSGMVTFASSPGIATLSVQSPFVNDSATYIFQSWNDTSTENPRSVDLEGELALTANFTLGNACLAYDTQTFTNPITISNQTTWSCVDYTFFSNVTITPTGSLNITNSIIRNGWIGWINNTGTLRVDGSTVGWPINVVTSSNFETENSTLYSLTVLSTATVTISQSRISEMLVYPEGNVQIVGFKPVLLTGDYDFAAWDMAAPHITVHSGSVVEDVSVSLAPGASATILQSEVGAVHASGPVTITGSQFFSLYLTAGTASITDSTITYLYVSGSSTCAVTSSQVLMLYLTGSTSDHVSVTGFDETRNDGGNYDFHQWGFSQIHVTTASSTVGHVSLSAGTVQVSDSNIEDIEASGTEHATILRSDIRNLSVGPTLGIETGGGVANATDSNIACGIFVGDGGAVRLLNVTENVEIGHCASVSEIVYGTGVLDKFWYTFVNVYNATTHQPISGVSLSIQDSLGHSQTATVNASARFTTREYRMLSSGTIEYTPYTFTFSKAGYNPTVVILQHFSNPVLNVYLQQATTTTTTMTITSGTNTTGTGGLSIAFGSAHVTVQPGSTAQFTVAVSSSQPVQVTLTVTEIPTGWQYAFTPSIGEANPQFVSTLTITTGVSTLPQAYAVMVNATADNGESVIASIIVEVASTTSTTTSSPKCVIATAAYGSEMASEVVYMRHVRDGLIGSTVIGRPIVQAWNTFYYLWSPPVAATIAQNSNLQALFRTLLMPLVAIVHVTAWVFTALGSGDFASVVAFTVAAALSISIYIAVPALLIREAWRQNKRRRSGGASG